MASLGELFVKIGIDSKDFEKSITGLTNKVKAAGEQMQDAGQSASLYLTAPLALLGGAALKTAAQIEQTEIAFTSMLGSAEAAQQFVKELTQFAANTPFEMEGLSMASKTLLGFGVESENVLDTLKTLGDIAAGSGAPLEQLSLVFGQVKATGKAMTQDLYQFINAGVPIFKLLAEEMGVSEGAIKDLAAEGKITFDVVSGALQKATQDGGLFANQMEKQSKSLSGLWSTFSDSVTLGLGKLGFAISEAVNLGELIPKMTKYVEMLVEKFNSLDGRTKKIIIVVAGLVAAIGPLLMGLGFLATTIIPSLIAGFTILLGPVGLIIAAVAGAAFLIYKYWDELVAYFTEGDGGTFFDSVKNNISIAVDKIKIIITQLAAAFEWVWDRIGQNFINQFVIAWDLIMDTVDFAVGYITDIISFWAAVFTGDFKGAVNAVFTAWKRVWNLIVSILTTAVKVVLNTLGTLIGFIDKDWGKAVNKGIKAVDKLSDSFKFDLPEAVEDGVEKSVSSVTKLKDKLEKEAKPTGAALADGIKKGLIETIDMDAYKKELYDELKDVNVSALPVEIEPILDDFEQEIEKEVFEPHIDAVIKQHKQHEAVVKKIKDAANLFAQKVGEAAKKLYQGITNGLKGLGSTVTGGMEQGGGAMDALMGGDIIGAMVSMFGDLAKNSAGFGALLTSIGEVVGAVFTALAPLFEVLVSAMQPLVGIIGSLMMTLGEMLISVLQPILPPLMQLLDIVVILFEALKPLVAAVGQLVGIVLQLVVSLLEPLMEPLAIIFDMLTMVVQAIGPLIDIIGNILVPVFEIIGAILENVIAPILAVVASVLELLAPILELVTMSLITLKPILIIITFALKIVGAIIMFVVEMIQKLADAIQKVVDWIKEKFGKKQEGEQEISTGSSTASAFSTGSTPSVDYSSSSSFGGGSSGGNRIEVFGELRGKGSDLIAVINSANKQKNFTT